MSEQQQRPLCIFCLKPTPRSEATAFPFLRVFSRFLKIHPDIEKNWGRICEQLVRCGDCSKPCESFSKVFFEWEQKGLLLTSMAGDVFDIIQRSKLAPSQATALENSSEEALNLNENVDKEYSPIKEVRQVLLEHCERGVMDSFPKVMISMKDEQKCLEKKELERKKKMGVKQAATVPKTRKKLIRFKRHDLKHKATSSFQAPWIKCSLCRYRTRCRGALGNHLTQVHKRVLVYQCNSCLVEALTMDGFRRHMLNCHLKKFKTHDMLMSAENVSYICADRNWRAQLEEELGLEPPISPSSSSSSSHVSGMEHGKDSTATSNSDGEVTKELQLKSSSPSDEEKLPEEKAKRLGYECKFCHKKYTNQRTLEIHIVYRHKNPVDTLSGKMCRTGENVAEKYNCPDDEGKSTSASLLQPLDDFDKHSQKLKDESTMNDLEESSPKMKTGTGSKNQQASDSRGNALNDGCSKVSLNINDYSGPTRFGGISDGDSNLDDVNKNQDNYSFK